MAVEQARKRSPASFDQWFSGVQFEGLEGDLLRLTARDEFVRDWIKTHFLSALLTDLGGLARGRESFPNGASEQPRVLGELKVEWRVCPDISRPIGMLAEPPAKSPRSEASHSRVYSVAAPLGGSDSPERAAVAPGENNSVVATDATLSPEAAPCIQPTERGQPRRSASVETTQGNYANRDSRLNSSSMPPSAGDPINPKHTFPNFVVGPSNELAYAAAIASAGAHGPRYNPLFICGGTGLGKTHLVHSIAHRLLETRPNRRVLYLSAERFTNEFIEALQHHRMEEFRSRYRRQCDALLMDDIQFLAGREQTQEEFFHTFNALRDLNRPIVVTSDKYPQELQRMPERLISRFTSGLVADVQTPALETRVAIIRKKAALEAIPLDDDVAVLLAQHIKSNVRELEGTLIRLAAKSSLLGRPIDMEFAKTELNAVNPLKPDTTSVAEIQRVVCGHFSLTSNELLSKNRHKSVAFARQVAMYLCRRRLKCSFPELGRAFGNRDHTTVISACRRVETLRSKDPQVDAHLQALETKLTADG